MASWMSEWCWTPSVDLLLLLNSARLTVLQRGCHAEPSPSQSSCEVSNKGAHTRRSCCNIKPGGTGPACCSWAGVCIPMLKSALPAGASGLGGLQQEVWGRKASRFPRQHHYPDYQPQALRINRNNWEYQSTYIPCYFKSRNQGPAITLKLFCFSQFMWWRPRILSWKWYRLTCQLQPEWLLPGVWASKSAKRDGQM